MNKLIFEIENFLAGGGIEEAHAEAKLLVECISGLSKEEIFMGASVKCEAEIWAAAKKRAETKAPIQHIIGFSYFMGDKFFVNKDVLIPRPETELLVRSCVDELSKMTGALNVLDIGTGSGCIALEIAKNLPEKALEIMGVDISTAALQTALENMNALGQERRVIFRKSDLFSGLRAQDKFDLIVSNPPYIPLSEKKLLQGEVRNFEPTSALFAEDEDGIEFYERILSGAKAHLKQDSAPILFEIGINQAEKIAALAEKLGFKTQYVLKDLAGIERVMCFR